MLDTARFESNQVFDAFLRTLTSICPDLGPADSLKWEVRGTPIPNLGLVEEQFDRFVQGYRDRLLKLLNRTCEQDYSASVSAALDARPPTPPQSDNAESPPPLLVHFTSTVAPALRATRTNLRALSEIELLALKQIVDIMLALGDCTAEDSAERKHWLYAAGRQFAETIEAKGFASGRQRTDAAVPATSDTEPAAKPYALAA